MPYGDDAKNERWKMSNEWKAYVASPFDETIKLESDILFPSSIDHWWNILSLKDVCFTVKVADYRGNISTSRAYREVFDINQLPDIYAGLYFFKKTNVSNELFLMVRDIFDNWSAVKTEILKEASNQPKSTDLAFALAVRMLGEENFYLPGELPIFAHMKGAIQGWHAESIWTEIVHHEFDRANLTVGMQRQMIPFHYHYKDFPKQSVITHYERLYNEQT